MWASQLNGAALTGVTQVSSGVFAYLCLKERQYSCLLGIGKFWEFGEWN